MVNNAVLVLGGRGFLGSRIIKDKPGDIDLWFTTRDGETDDNRQTIRLDLTKPSGLQKIIDKINPSLIIHCARLDPFDSDPVKSAEITKEIVKTINNHSIKILYISSDAVFDGKRGNYKEGDMKSPITNYGKAKSAAENAIQESCNKYIIVRTANIYGKKNDEWDVRTTSMINELKLGKITHRFNDAYRSFTLVDNLSKSIWRLVNSNFNGIINISGVRKSFFEFSQEMASNLGVSPDQIKGVSFKEENANIAQDTSLDNSLAQSLHFV